MIDFKVPRLRDKILIDTKNWVQNSSGCTLGLHRMSGRPLPTYIAKVLEVNAHTEELKNAVQKGDTVLLTRVVSDVSMYKSFSTELDNNSYFNVPIMQILGVFKNGDISINSLKMLFDKILVRKIESKSKLILSNDNTMIGEVVKVGTCRFDKDWNSSSLTVRAGDKVLIRDNVTTEVYLDGEYYYAVEESMIVSIFTEDKLKFDESMVINNNIILEPYIPESTSIFLTPNLNYEDEDYTEIYNRDLFKVIRVDSLLTELQEGDIILVNRNITNYVYYNENKYFIISGIENVEAKIIK